MYTYMHKHKNPCLQALPRHSPPATTSPARPGAVASRRPPGRPGRPPPAKSRGPTAIRDAPTGPVGARGATNVEAMAIELLDVLMEHGEFP